MCGIAGIINPKQSPEQNSGVLDAMLRTQHHRGPDATGKWSDGVVHLGHNRLSIIDLSEAANQPMHYGKYTLIYNGELYNYIELKKELEQLNHRFVTRSDSEVILHAYEQWGTGCTDRFVGMWAFVIWDTQKKELFASRDRFGIKPFYYIRESDTLYFASEIKTLKQTPAFSNEVNLAQVSRGLQMGWLGYEDETYYSKIKALPAACNLIMREGVFEVKRYWDISTGNYLSESFGEKCQKFYDLFSQSVHIHMRSDVPVGSCLSGGLDSSAIASMVQQQHPDTKYKTYSIYYEGDGDVDERPFIKQVIDKYPSIEPHYFSPTDSQVAEHFHHALYHADVPVTGSSFMSQYFLMKMIGADGVKVVLDGQGADEYLGGYMHTFYRLIAGMMKQMHIGRAVSTTSAINKQLGNAGMKTAAHFGKSLLALTQNEQKLYSIEYRNYWPFMTNAGSNRIPFDLKKVAGTPMDNFLYHLMFHTSLPSLLHYEDRNSMAFSVESRVPFLDHRLVEYAFSLRDHDKIHGTETKYVMREALKSILPEGIYNRKDKKGFVTPGENKWLRGPLKHLLRDDLKLPDYINNQKAGRMMDDYRKGDNSKATMVWRLATLAEWGR